MTGTDVAVLANAMLISQTTTIGELMDYCRVNNTTPRELVASAGGSP